jgi:hypothetical protein
MKTKNIFETYSSELGMNKQEIQEHISSHEFSKTTSEICLNDRKIFEDDHLTFKQLGIKYINFNETDKTDIFRKNMVDIVEHESRYLPEIENYFLENKSHTTLQKFSPDNFEDKGYDILVNFISDMLKL